MLEQFRNSEFPAVAAAAAELSLEEIDQLAHFEFENENGQHEVVAGLTTLRDTINDETLAMSIHNGNRRFSEMEAYEREQRIKHYESIAERHEELGFSIFA